MLEDRLLLWKLKNGHEKGLVLAYGKYGFELPEAYREAMLRFTVHGFIDMLYQAGDSRELDPKNVQGIDALGFEVTDWSDRIFGGAPQMFHLLLNPQQATARAWINPGTKLPVQTEAECELGGSVITFFQSARLEVIDDRLEWGKDMEESMFLPAISEGYTSLTIPAEGK